MSRVVECQDCGYRWTSSADAPRCSQQECGRSRNVEPVEDVDDEQDDEEAVEDVDDDVEQETSTMDPTDEETETDDDRSTETADVDDGFSPAFESLNQSADPVDDVEHVEHVEPESDEESDDDDDAADESDEESDDAAEVPTLEPEDIEVAFTVGFDMAAERRGEHWELRDGEAERLAEAWTPVANLYAPVLLAEHTEVGIAVMATAAIVGPRLMEDRRRAEQEEAEERAQRDEETGTTRTERTVENEPETDAWQTESEQTVAAGGYDRV